MIPREILKKLRPIERRPNRIVSVSAACCCVRIPTGFRPKAHGCEARATLDQRPAKFTNRNAVAALPCSSAPRVNCLNPVGVAHNLIPHTQGYMPETLWDSPMGAIRAANSVRAASSFVIHPSSFPPA